MIKCFLYAAERCGISKRYSKQTFIFLFFLIFGNNKFNKNISLSLGWNYSVGFINEEMIKNHLYAADDNNSTIVLMCGPPPMINNACLPALNKLGFHPDTRFTY